MSGNSYTLRWSSNYENFTTMDRYLFSVESSLVVALDTYPEVVMKMYYLLLLLGI